MSQQTSSSQQQQQPFQTDARPFHTDASRRTALPHASLKSNIQVPAVDSETFLQNHEEEWNRLVDAEVEALAEGMADLVGIASIEGKDRFQIAQEAFQAECRAESIAIAANSLLSITHSLKLMFLLGDEQYITQRRKERLKSAVSDITAAKSRVESAWDGLREPRILDSIEFAKTLEEGGGDTEMRS
ncbi:mediator complex subunit Med22 [Ceratobasidium sp. AG-Ba]|nr:mediator complex subunit Med22 [Ceratobasidium sp. AG-Ba]